MVKHGQRRNQRSHSILEGTLIELLNIAAYAFKDVHVWSALWPFVPVPPNPPTHAPRIKQGDRHHMVTYPPPLV